MSKGPATVLQAYAAMMATIATALADALAAGVKPEDAATALDSLKAILESEE